MVYEPYSAVASPVHPRPPSHQGLYKGGKPLGARLPIPRRSRGTAHSRVSTSACQNRRGLSMGWSLTSAQIYVSDGDAALLALSTVALKQTAASSVSSAPPRPRLDEGSLPGAGRSLHSHRPSTPPQPSHGRKTRLRRDAVNYANDKPQLRLAGRCY